MKRLKCRADFEAHEWNTEEFQVKNSVRTLTALKEWLNVSANEERGIQETQHLYSWQITPHYLSLMSIDNENCPIRKQAIPNSSEIKPTPTSDIDPVGDMQFLKTPRIIHKYPSRVVFLVSDSCPVYCRHCTRKYHTTHHNGTYYGEGYKNSFKLDLQYIRKHEEIDDVLLTGGDPLSLNDAKLEYLISSLRSIPHVRIIRIGTRYPVLMPQRITQEFAKMLEKYHPIWLSTHFNHPKEINEDSIVAIDLLSRVGVPLQNQTVLLKGINDSIETMRALVKKLIEIRVRPYYLYHCDNVTGVSHFKTSIQTGRHIMESLIGFETGFAVPQYVITTKAGKIPLQPSFVTENEEKITAWGYKGEAVDVTAEFLEIV